MKRLVVLAAVTFLVITAGCGMTSQAAREAQQEGTTTSAGSNPADTAPVGAMLPDGYTQSGLEDPELAYEQHMDALQNRSYSVKYSVRGAENGTLLYYAFTNVSMEEERWRSWTKSTGADGNVTEQLYQTTDTRYRLVEPENGPTNVTSSATAFAPIDGTHSGTSLKTILENINISGAQASQSGHSYIAFSVDSYAGEPVDRAHLFVYPSGRIWGMMLTVEDKQILYISRQAEDMSVAEPTWIGNSTADS